MAIIQCSEAEYLLLPPSVRANNTIRIVQYATVSQLNQSGGGSGLTKAQIQAMIDASIAAITVSAEASSIDAGNDATADIVFK